METNNSTASLIFVYGTLKRGEPNYHFLEKPERGNASFVGEGSTLECYPLVVSSRFLLPFLLDLPGTGKVRTISFKN